MGWTSPTTFTTGQVPDADLFNQQIRDNLNAAGNHTGWSTYSPTLTGWAANPSYRKGHYLRVGNLVFYAYHITLGATGSATTHTVSLPVNGNMDNDLRCGSGYLYDASAYDAWTTVHYSSSTAASTVKVMWNAKTADGVVTNLSPFTFAANDEVGGLLIYKAAG